MDRVGKRRLKVLKLLYEYPLALPKRPIWYNLRREYNFGFGEDTTGDYIDELVEMELIDELDIGNGYYVINDNGVQYFENNEEELDIV